MNIDISQKVRPHLLTLKPYSSAKDEFEGEEGIFLDANENPFGSATEIDFNRYPDPQQKKIKAKLAKLKKCETNQIFLGNGSDEAIDLLMRAFCEPIVDNILILPPTYGMYEVSANINNIEIKRADLDQNYQLNLADIYAKVDKNTKIVWVCSPNNPSGNLLRREDIFNLVNNLNCFVVIDEAYIDFVPDESFLSEISNHNNLIILQTFSKAWGLAGLRIGMCFANFQVIAYLNKIKPPYNINLVTQQQTLLALENEEKKKMFVNQLIEERNFLIEKLSGMSLVEKINKSDTNYLLVKVKNANELFQFLVDNLIIVRNRANVTLCEGCFRISVGTRAENTALLEQIAIFQAKN